MVLIISVKLERGVEKLPVNSSKIADNPRRVKVRGGELRMRPTQSILDACGEFAHIPNGCVAAFVLQLHGLDSQEGLPLRY